MSDDLTTGDPGQATPPEEPTAAETSLADELKGMGVHLAAALRAAASTQEAQELRGDLREGLRALKAEVDEALAKAPVDALREKAQRPSGTAVRSELAGAIRSFNKALDRLAASVERDKPNQDQ